MSNSLDTTSRRIRRNILHMVHRANSSHVGTAFSCVDLLTVLQDDLVALRATDDSLRAVAELNGLTGFEHRTSLNHYAVPGVPNPLSRARCGGAASAWCA